MTLSRSFQDLKHILPNASTRDVPPWVTLGRRKVYYILGRSAGGAVPQTARQQEDERINSVDNQTHALEARCVVRRASRICSTFGRLRIDEVKSAKENLNTEIERVESQMADLQSEIETAEALAQTEDAPLDETVIPSLESAISQAKTIEFTALIRRPDSMRSTPRSTI